MKTLIISLISMAFGLGIIAIIPIQLNKLYRKDRKKNFQIFLVFLFIYIVLVSVMVLPEWFNGYVE